MKKYILYARVASQQQADANSLTQQIDDLQEYAKTNNLEIGEVISEFASGTSIDRVGIKTMLKRLSTGQYNGVLCTKIDRLCRNWIDFSVFHRFMEEKGMEIITTQGKFENKLESSPADKFISTVMAAVGEYNRTLMSERIKAGIKKAKLEGKNVFATQKQN